MQLAIKDEKLRQSRKITLSAKDCQWSIKGSTLTLLHGDVDLKMPLNEIRKIQFWLTEINQSKQDHMSITLKSRSLPTIAIKAGEGVLNLRAPEPISPFKLQVLFDDIAIWSVENPNKIKWVNTYEETNDMTEKVRTLMMKFILICLLAFAAYLAVRGDKLAFVFVPLVFFYAAGIAAAKMMPIDKDKYDYRKFISRKF